MMNTKVKKIKVEINVLTGLLISSGVETFEIGGVDKVVVRTVYKMKDENNKEKELNVPYIPGSSLKGKISSLLERHYFGDLLKLMKIQNVVENCKNLENIKEIENALKKFRDYTVIIDESSLHLIDNLNEKESKIKAFFEKIKQYKEQNKNKKIFEDPQAILALELLEKYYDNGKIFENVRKIDRDKLLRFLKLFRSIGGVVLVFEDFYPTKETIEYWYRIRDMTYDLGTEVKSENVIDRLTGKASNPRSIERVVPGSKFVGYIIYTPNTDDEKEIEKDIELIKEGLNLLKNTNSYLGSSGSRGYGRIDISCTEEHQNIQSC